MEKISFLINQRLKEGEERVEKLQKKNITYQINGQSPT